MVPALPFQLQERYEVIEEIGRGGHAVVYRALDRSLARDVAVKMLRDDVLVPEIRARFTQEIQVLATLQHPHILHVHDSGTYGQRPYVVMELAPAQTLAHRLAREPQLPLSDAVAITREVASALAHAHARSVLHRDVKPENILLGPGGAILADFGIARVTGEMAISRITSTGEAVGTLAYMSPEQLCAESVDARSDQYALACVLYEMLAGVRPHTAATFEGLRALRLTGRQAPVSVYRPSVPPVLEDVLHRAMAVTAADRYRSMDEFLMALELMRTGDAAIASGSFARVTGGGRTVAAPGRRTRWQMPALLAVVVLGAGALLKSRTATRDTIDGAPAGALTVSVAPTTDPLADSVRARVAGELSAWKGVRVESGDGGALRLAVAVTSLNDSVQLRLDARGAGNPFTATRMLARAALRTADATIATLAREVLAGRAANEVPGLDGIPERSLPALRAYVRGHTLLRAGELDSATQAFRAARDTLPRFAQARFWAAQSAAWSTPKAVDRWKSDADEAVRIGTLRGTDSLLAVGLQRMAAMDFVGACGAYRAAVANGEDFASEMGSARCLKYDSLVVRDVRGLRFRSSAAEILRHYRRAISLSPTGELLGTLFPEMIAATYAIGNILRFGRSEGGGTVYRAMPSLAGDSLFFIPVEEGTLARLGGSGVPLSWSAAVRWSRAAAVMMTARAVELHPATASLWFHRAYALELTERIDPRDSVSAGAALDRAALSTNPTMQVGVSIARIRLAIRNEDFAQAIQLSRTLVQQSRLSSAVSTERERVVPIAAWLGDAAALEALLDRSGKLPSASADSLRRFSAAIYSGDCKAARALLPGLVTSLQTSIAQSEQRALWGTLVVPTMRRAIPCLGLPEFLRRELGGDPLDSAFLALERNDLSETLRVLARERAGRIGAASCAISWDRLYIEAWMLTKVGRPDEARASLVQAIENLASQSPTFLEDVVPAWGLRQGLLLLRTLLDDSPSKSPALVKLHDVLSAVTSANELPPTGLTR
jgi:serine/threonine-protein kinase